MSVKCHGRSAEVTPAEERRIVNQVKAGVPLYRIVEQHRISKDRIREMVKKA